MTIFIKESLQYKHSAPGSVERSLSDRLDDEISVKTFGAVGDGVTDDTAAFNLALDASDSVKIPAGTYFLSSTVRLNGNKALYGAGRGTTTIVWGHNSTVFDVAGSTTGWRISDMTIMKSGNVAASDGTVISALASPFGTIARLFIGYACNGITLNKNCLGTTIEDIQIWCFRKDGLTFRSDLNYSTYLSDVFISDILLNGDTTNTGQRGAASRGVVISELVEALMFDQVECIFCQYPLVTGATNNTFAKRPGHCVFSQCYFDTSECGVVIDKVTNFKFAQCWFSSAHQNGLTLGNCETVTFNQCDFANNGWNGCEVNNSVKRARWMGCTFAGNSTAVQNTFHGLTIATGTSDFGVTDCIATNEGWAFGSQAYGIRIAGGISDRYIVTNNLISGNATGGLVDGGYGVNKNVANNF